MRSGFRRSVLFAAIALVVLVVDSEHISSAVSSEATNQFRQLAYLGALFDMESSQQAPPDIAEANLLAAFWRHRRASGSDLKRASGSDLNIKH